ncbi:Endoplasmic reticulum zinc transporter [Mortierella alpina]|uniref:Endoplasmic reticulum zinc transporter n=1 Tax=Mortierella alpina TaxID=64518 RepID=A0A9P6J8A7_MORAP|nr:Endoplasmic reticulum zinc transporter [Mortierella alpina]
MDANPQLLRRTHSPFVAAAAAAAASSTLAVETHTHQHTHHQHPHQHQHQHDHAHAVGQAQPHLSPLLGQGLRPTGRSSPLLAGDLSSHGGKQLARNQVRPTDFTRVRMRDMRTSISTITLRTISTNISTNIQGNRSLSSLHRTTAMTILDTPTIIPTHSTSTTMATSRYTVTMGTTTAMTTTIMTTITATITATHTDMIIVTTMLPSYGEIFAGLMPQQKTMFTWILVHSLIAILTWLSGMRAGSLSIIGLSYMTLFDAFGVLNTFISSVIHTDRNMKKSTVKHPFGIQRFAILFGLFNAIFLLFIGMNMLKESLEHLMLEDDHHGGDHGAVAQVPIFWTLIALGAALISTLGYQNHKQYCLLLNHTSPSNYGHSTSSDVATLFRNPFALTSLGCAVGALMVAMFPRWDSLDKIVAIGQAIVMFWLGGPLTKVLGMILLQTAPPRALDALEDAIRQLSGTNLAIQRIERAHVWTNTVGQLIGTLIVSVTKGADDQAILASIHERLKGVLEMDGEVDGTGELTVQLVHH